MEDRLFVITNFLSLPLIENQKNFRNLAEQDVTLLDPIPSTSKFIFADIRTYTYTEYDSPFTLTTIGGNKSDN